MAENVQTSHRINQDPKDPSFFQNPYALYERMHAIGGPVYWEDYGFWCLAGFDPVNDCLKDNRFARVAPPSVPAAPYPEHLSAFAEVEKYSLLALEPPSHTRIRRCVNHAFVNRQIANMQTGVEELAHSLIDEFEPLGQVELLKQYASVIPVTVIARLLGVPSTECNRLLAWSHAMVRVYTLTQTTEEEHKANTASEEFRTFLLELIEERRQQPRDDLLTHLVTAENGELSNEEIISTTVLLLNAGHEATVHQIGNAVKTLLENHWQHNWFESDKSTDRVVAETMRYDAPLHLFLRYAQEHVELENGVVIQEGEQVALLLGAANRDPKKFSNANTFNPDRSDGAHVSLGAGLHFCVGAQLAKMELRVALATLFNRLPSLKLAESPQYQNSYHFHGLDALHLQW